MTKEIEVTAETKALSGSSGPPLPPPQTSRSLSSMWREGAQWGRRGGAGSRGIQRQPLVACRRSSHPPPPPALSQVLHLRKLLFLFRISLSSPRPHLFFFSDFLTDLETTSPKPPLPQRARLSKMPLPPALAAPLPLLGSLAAEGHELLPEETVPPLSMGGGTPSAPWQRLNKRGRG